MPTTWIIVAYLHLNDRGDVGALPVDWDLIDWNRTETPNQRSSVLLPDGAVLETLTGSLCFKRKKEVHKWSVPYDASLLKTWTLGVDCFKGLLKSYELIKECK